MAKITISDVENVQEFFADKGLLKMACEETGLEYYSVRRNMHGDADQVKMITAVFLWEWVKLWEKQREARKNLAKKIQMRIEKK